MSATSVMIVAGEASGDLHGANLVRALRGMVPDLAVSGMGGREMRAAGVEILYDAAKMAVVGLYEVLAHLQDIRAALRTLEQRLREKPPRLLILIDYPDFNLILARKAKRLGIPIMYYISPQVWAWRSGRVKKIGRLVDRLAVILPFEQAFYADRGLKVDFVGHPLRDTVETRIPREDFLKAHRIPADATVIGILPGSRRKEIATLLPVFLKAAALVAPAIEKPVFLLPLAPTLTLEDLQEHGLRDCGLEVRVIEQDRYELMAACRAVVTASGTVTLELAILGVPLVVCYRISALTYFLGRRLIKVEFASLVNLVAGERVVPELLQQDATPEKIGRALRSLLTEEPERRKMLRGLATVKNRLGGPGASRRAARVALELLNRETA